MASRAPLRVLVSGAGTAGSVAAYWLGRAGHAVTVVERSPELRKVRAAAGPAVLRLRRTGRLWTRRTRPRTSCIAWACTKRCTIGGRARRESRSSTLAPAVLLPTSPSTPMASRSRTSWRSSAASSGATAPPAPLSPQHGALRLEQAPRDVSLRDDRRSDLAAAARTSAGHAPHARRLV